MTNRQIKISRIQHVGIPVRDLNVSSDFYKSLGFEQVMKSSFTHEGAEGKVLMMKSGEVVIEIYQLPVALNKRTAGSIDHIAFDVAGIDEVFQNLKNEGFLILEDAPRFLPFWKNGCKFFNILGPDGERLEFNQIL
ncbi:VOC family protein [Aggregatimonas sangjinii]|uniref:VOC family protein n=1 Tax=Aggregatimonas sangjinii TaxID=2583587 RepID=A0A5B7SQ62_9FLAO|nr:VOC family protein [Aggregatimonas sangjinii]QCX00677.1 VOC family protein [Aggregatimonas sangjinii]